MIPLHAPALSTRGACPRVESANRAANSPVTKTGQLNLLPTSLMEAQTYNFEAIAGKGLADKVGALEATGIVSELSGAPLAGGATFRRR